MGVKLRAVWNVVGIGLAAVCPLLSGCGGKGNAANVITVTITSSSGMNLILGQSTTLTATVNGANNPKVNWTPVCQYTTTTTDSNGKTTTSKPLNCPQDTSVTPPDDNHTIFGVFSNQQTTGTEVFTATTKLPDPKTYPGLVIIATAQSVQNTSRTGTFNLTLNSGIGITFTPTTASVPVNEPQTFTAFLINDIGQTTGVTWALTQQVPNPTAGSNPNPYTPLATCSPTCGSLNVPDPNNPNTVIYTAPPAVPTTITPAQTNNTNSPANVTIFAVSKADPTRYVPGTITLTPGGPITFNGISPTIAPQGATLWDIYLDAPNISSATTITLTYPGNVQRIKKSDSGQIKVLFPVPASSSSSSSSSSTTCSTTTPCSTGARLRLNAEDLATAGPVTVSVVDPAEPCNTIAAGTPCTATGAGTFTIMPVRPTSTATVPDDIVQGAQTLNFPVTIDGGYFGPFGPNVTSPSNFIRAYFQSPGNDLLINPTSSSSRQLVTSLPASSINPNNPGLYPLYVASTASPAPTPPNASVTNIAIFPDYSTKAPAIPACLSSIPAGTNPSAVDIDTALGVLVVAEAGSPSATPAVPSALQFYGITTVPCSSNPSGAATTLQPIDGNGAPCTPSASPAPGSTCPYVSNPAANYTINVPTGISVDRTSHTVAVVNYGDQSVTVLQVPVPGATQSAFTPFNISLSGALENSVSPAPLPYSIGVDPDSHLALVAYSSTSTSSVANLGFIVNLNPDSSTTPNRYGCPLDHALTPSSTKAGQCLFSQVTLNTGTYPQVAVSSHGHSALVTPGGSGVVREVDVTKPSTANLIRSASLSGGVVTVSVDTTQCPPGVSPTSSSTTNPCPLTMVPGFVGSVLITGLTAKNSANNALFNGVFTVSVTSNNTFTYAPPNTTATDACQPPSGATSCGGEVFYSQPDQIFGLTNTSQGIAINPITSTAAIADVNATGNIGAQINLLSGLDQSTSSILFSPNCTAFTTTCSTGSPELLPTADVAWQPFTNLLVSYNPHLNQVSISDPVSHRRYAFACASSSACQVNPIVSSQISLSGTGTATLAVQNGTTNSLTLFGGLAVDPVTNQAFVVKSGSGAIDVVDLGGATPVKPAHISEVIVPSPPNAGQGTIGGIPNALVPQAALTCTNPTPPATCDLPGVRILGSGFASGMTVRLDGVDITTQGGSVGAPLNGGREVDVTIPASALTMPHHFALDVLSSGAQSNAVEFIVVQSIDLSKVCTANGSPTNTMPASVAIADQIANGPFSPFALVSVTGCNSIVQIDLNPTSATFGQLLGGPISVGANPQGIAIWQHQGLAVVANNGAGTASVMDLTKSPPAPVLCGSNPCGDVTTGTNSTGVAINEATGAAIVTNTGSNTISMINLALLFPPSGTTPPTTLTATSIGGVQQPTAVAIDPDRGANNQGLAVVASIQLSNASAPSGSLTPIDIDKAPPNISTASPGFVSSIPTGIVFDPAVATSTTNSGVFFANSSGTNAITEYNPDSGGGSSVSVGVNPTSLAINPQTGAMLTANSASNTISIVDTIASPFKTHQTLGIPGSPTFGVAIDQFTNLAVIVDQANMRVLLFPMPN